MLRGCLKGRNGFGGSRIVVGERGWSFGSGGVRSEVVETSVEVFSPIEVVFSVVLDWVFAMADEPVFGGYFLKKVRSRGGNERASSMCC